MSRVPSPAASTPWSRDREPRWGRAGLLAVLALALVTAFAPVEWLRGVFGRDFGFVDVATRDRVEPFEGIRLIPVPRRAPSAAESAPPQVAAPSLRSDPVEDTVESAAPDPTFVWDPTSAFSPADELLTPAVPDSILLRAALLDALAQGRPESAFAFFDTTQVTAAHRQFDWMDAYMNDVLRPLYEAEGYRQRVADIYYRAVGEVEEEGGL